MICNEIKNIYHEVGGILGHEVCEFSLFVKVFI